MDGAPCLRKRGVREGAVPRVAALFGASGGIGAALVEELAARGCGLIHAGSRSGSAPEVPQVRPFRFDLTDEASIAAAAGEMAKEPPDWVLIATGVLTLPGGEGPERSWRALDASTMVGMLRINTIGPALVARHMLPLLRRDRRSVLAALSARVGSIGDNRLGGWHSYRASKAALNMLLRNFAIELARSHPQAVVAGLHPGTVDTALSAPFQRGLPEGQLLAPEESARHLLDVLGRLEPSDSGGVFDWRGERVPE